MTDEELRAELRAIGSKIDTVDTKVSTHLGDRYAHGWDHERIGEGKALVAEWVLWRAGIDRWRYMMMGGLGLIVILIPSMSAIVIWALSKG